MEFCIGREINATETLANVAVKALEDGGVTTSN
jgi:hypothetical protein